MKEKLDITDVVVKGSGHNTVTIARTEKPTHNRARVIKTPEIVVNCFSDEEITYLRGIDLSKETKKNGGWSSVIGKYVPNFIEKNLDKLKDFAWNTSNVSIK